MINASPIDSLTAPRNRRYFRHAWDEISYRCTKASFLLHDRDNRPAARPHIRRLSYLLKSVHNGKGAIVRQTARALLAEYNGLWQKAVFFRKLEADLIVKLHISLKDEPRAVRDFALKGRHKLDVFKQFSTLQYSYHRKFGPEASAAFIGAVHSAKSKLVALTGTRKNASARAAVTSHA